MAGSEVTVSQSQGLTYNIIQAAELLESQGSVTITAINSAISSAITLAEMLKHKVKGLHQLNAFERLPETTKTKVVIKLSYKAFFNAEKGYQLPIPESEVQEKPLAELKKPPWEDKNNETRGESSRVRPN